MKKGIDLVNKKRTSNGLQTEQEKIKFNTRKPSTINRHRIEQAARGGGRSSKAIF